MSATYSSVPKDLPSRQKSVLVTAVEVGDQISFVDILGRPARGVQLRTTDAADVTGLRINNGVRVSQHNESSPPTVSTRWSTSFPTVTFTGLTVDLPSGLEVASLEVVSLSLSVGTEIEIFAW